MQISKFSERPWIVTCEGGPEGLSITVSAVLESEQKEVAGMGGKR
jgi:hypothetical protein